MIYPHDYIFLTHPMLGSAWLLISSPIISRQTTGIHIPHYPDYVHVASVNFTVCEMEITFFKE